MVYGREDITDESLRTNADTKFGRDRKRESLDYSMVEWLSATKCVDRIAYNKFLVLA